MFPPVDDRLAHTAFIASDQLGEPVHQFACGTKIKAAWFDDKIKYKYGILHASDQLSLITVAIIPVTTNYLLIVNVRNLLWLCALL